MMLSSWLNTLFRRMRRMHRRHVDDDHITKTGETVAERRAYHDRGDLSPGEHAMAKAIREHLRGPDAPCS